MSRSPVAARRRLGATLKELRTNSGYLIEDAAKELRCSNSKVSRLENGKAVPRHRDVRDLIGLYGDRAAEQADQLFELVAQSLSEGQGLVTQYRDVIDSDMVSDDVARFLALEQDSSTISSFEPDLIPGLLQTPDYIDALVRLYAPERTVRQRSRLVELRVGRQGILDKPTGKTTPMFVVGEQALHRRIGDPGVMQKQLATLHDELSNGRSHVEFRIAPITLVDPGVLGGPFAVLEFGDPQDQDIVYLEGRDSATYLETDDQVSRYKAIFGGLVAQCPSRKRSLAMVKEAADALS